jgi:adenylate cyclase
MATFTPESRRRFLRSSLLTAAVIAVAMSVFMQRGWLDWAENPSYDMRALQVAVNASTAVANQIVIIDIDNASFDQLKPMFGRWPWTRRVWTEVVRYTAKGKPKVIGVDIILGGAESKEVDEDFAKVMKDAGNVVTSFSLSPTQLELEDDASVKEKLAALEKHGAKIAGNTVGEKVDLRSVALNTPLSSYADAAIGLGAINTIADSDGVIRRVPLQFILGGRAYPSLALRMAEIAQQLPRTALLRTAGVEFSGRTLPVDRNGRLILAWNNAIDNQRIPLWEVICSIYPEQCPQGVKTFPPEYFKGKVILLGASASASYDAHNFPIGEQKPGFIMQMTALENLLRGRAVQTVSPWISIFLVVLMVAAGTGAVMVLPSAAWNSVLTLFAAAVYIFICVWAMQWNLVWLPMAAPLMGLFGSYVSASVIRYATTGRELRKTRGMLERFIAPDLVKDFMDKVNLAGEKKDLTILFSDVRSFTTMTEGTEPMELIRTLNEYLEAMTEIIDKYGGITDKFIGDGILAYWGAYNPGANHAELGCRAALEMFERLDELNAGWLAQGRKELAIGVGLNTGEVVFGVVGTGKKQEITVIGDPVNLAARLESTTKEFGAKTIISEFTYARVKELVEVRPLGGVKVKGKTVETQIFELKSMSPKASANAAVIKP